MNLIMNLVLRQTIMTIKALKKQNSLICNSTRNTKFNCIILRRSSSANLKILSVLQAMRCPLIYMLLRWHGSTNSNNLFSMTKSMTFTIMNSTTINKLRNSISKIIILGISKMSAFWNRLTNISELTTSKILQTLWWKGVWQVEMATRFKKCLKVFGHYCRQSLALIMKSEEEKIETLILTGRNMSSLIKA